MTIKQIKVADTASYNREGITLEPKTFTLIYGWNGTGKTTISRYLGNRQNNEYKNCKIVFDPNKEPELLVYNRNYIEKVFYEKPTQQGIFILGEENTEAQKVIDKAKKEIEEKLKPQQETVEGEIASSQTAIASLDKDLQEDLLFYPREYEKTSLSFCLSGHKIGPALKNKILQTDISPLDINSADQGLERLAKEAAELVAEGAKKRDPHKLLDSYQNDDRLSLLSASIIGSESSYLKETIDKLNHEVWLKDGMGYLDQTEDCPFCRQHIDRELKEKLKAHFDASYQEKVAQLQNIKQRYQKYCETLKDSIEQYKEDQNYLADHSDFKLRCAELTGTLDSNLEKMADKIRNPAESIEIETIDMQINNVNQILQGVNTKINSFNEKIENIESAKTDIEVRFWGLVRYREQKNITEYKREMKKHEDDQKKKKLELGGLLKEIKEQEEIIRKNQENIISIDQAATRINDELTRVGITGFFLEKYNEPENSYCLRRGDGKTEFQSLSEGEKNLLSFLYFIQSCQGTNDRAQAVDLKNRVIVIDDPISSLSFNHIFDIADLIKKTFFPASKNTKTKFGQVILLTHHIFFFHEILRVIKVSNTNTALYRLTKNNCTLCTKMEKDDIKNSYEAYWQTIKDVQSKKADPVILPNAMRNILEHYFGFIQKKEKLHEILDLPEYSPLKRILNSYSHSDSENLLDRQEIDLQKTLGLFQQFFIDAKHQEHYNVMMGINKSS